MKKIKIVVVDLKGDLIKMRKELDKKWVNFSVR